MVSSKLWGKPRNIRIVCPRDGGRLIWDEAGLTCPECGADWSRDGDVPLFGHAAEPSPAGPTPADVSDRPDSFQRGVDWRFLIPLEATSRVLVAGFQGEGVVSALAPDVDTVGTLESDPDRARVLGSRGPEFENVIPVLSSGGLVPFADSTFDVVVLDPDLLPRSRAAKRERLRLLSRKLKPGGHLFLPVENRWGRLFPGDTGASTGRSRPGQMGMDGWRWTLRSTGFRDVRFHAAFPDARRPRELIPLDEPSVLAWWWKRFRGESRLADAAIRYGLLARLAPHYAVVARKGSRS